jgi:hypothetical protein
VFVRRLISCILVSACFTPAIASTVRISITGTTKGVYVEEGPIFGYSSYQHIPDGTPFSLIYTFDDQRGRETIVAVDEGFITESRIENTPIASPGTNAVLQIGDATWEFGSSMLSSANLNTSLNKRRYELAFATPSRGNHISVVIQPSKDGFWPVNADWRASFMATSLMDSGGEFSADNNSVSARGHLLPIVLTISGVDLGEQWLSYKTIAGGPKGASWSRQWHLAHPTHKGGYIVEEVTRTFTGVPSAGSAIVATERRYWTAWKVSPDSADITDAMDSFTSVAHGTRHGVETIYATARFYEGLNLPEQFSIGPGHDADSLLFSTSAPNLRTNQATLPVRVEATLQ